MAPLVPGWPLPGRRSGALGAGRGWGSGTHESGRDGTRDPGCRWWGQEARGQWGWGSQAVDSSKGEGVSTYGDWPVSWVKSRRFIVVKEIKRQQRAGYRIAQQKLPKPQAVVLPVLGQRLPSREARAHFCNDGRVCPERRGGPGARGWASVGLWSHLSPPLSVQAELLGECQAVGHRMDWLPCRPVSWEPLQLCPLGTGHQARLQAARWRDVTPSPPALLRPLWAQALLPAASSVEVT